MLQPAASRGSPLRLPPPADESAGRDSIAAHTLGKISIASTLSRCQQPSAPNVEPHTLREAVCSHALSPPKRRSHAQWGVRFLRLDANADCPLAPSPKGRSSRAILAHARAAPVGTPPERCSPPSWPGTGVCSPAFDGRPPRSHPTRPRAGRDPPRSAPAGVGLAPTRPGCILRPDPRPLPRLPTGAHRSPKGPAHAQASASSSPSPAALCGRGRCRWLAVLVSWPVRRSGPTWSHPHPSASRRATATRSQRNSGAEAPTGAPLVCSGPGRSQVQMALWAVSAEAVTRRAAEAARRRRNDTSTRPDDR